MHSLHSNSYCYISYECTLASHCIVLMTNTSSRLWGIQRNTMIYVYFYSAAQFGLIRQATRYIKRTFVGEACPHGASCILCRVSLSSEKHSQIFSPTTKVIVCLSAGLKYTFVHVDCVCVCVCVCACVVVLSNDTRVGYFVLDTAMPLNQLPS